MRSYLLAGNTAHYDGVLAAFEARGIEVVPAFASGLDARPAVEQFFVRDGKPVVDAIVSLTGFSLVGGPAYNDARAAEEMLAGLDVPYIAAQALEFQTLEQWEASDRGLMPVEATMMVAIPELDGATWPTVFGGRSGRSGVARHAVLAGHEAFIPSAPMHWRAKLAKRHHAAAHAARGAPARRRASSTSRRMPAPRERRPSSRSSNRCSTR